MPDGQDYSTRVNIILCIRAVKVHSPVVAGTLADLIQIGHLRNQ